MEGEGERKGIRSGWDRGNGVSAAHGCGLAKPQHGVDARRDNASRCNGSLIYGVLAEEEQVEERRRGGEGAGGETLIAFYRWSTLRSWFLQEEGGQGENGIDSPG